MGRLLLIILVIVAIVLLWKAFKPSTWKRNAEINQGQAPRAVKGPDDDEEFLWNIEKNRFKQRRAEEAAQLEEEERLKRARERYAKPEASDDGTEKPTEDS
ncbi:hypothetical protein J433_10057 [Corynebacterium glutamicum MT]|uniref:Secreted protein n=2 Tax=Corynebacterium glutamicum TaxID=1718 RepID=A0AB36IBN3_CORGT|nr:hypothetical protein [Corynebacterium glutamicum]AGN18110.1 hypothetical protein C624_02605 [Corynebacterium glutamicum SCgG1]AGN21133.1 hypothetical protein C629_02605 [Corynebacterium glutamicum SCgG2]EGV41038.1 hypothetical protein CgS9114_05442 [Corynebacterium glutamicum S9114]EOA64157.1 hypothetical protein J433_10057 [Corynebacterium glutamicum MT]EPP41852.1 hypothetical protein A583_02141 [Corynebacterium glutamicum Z188]